MKKYCDYYYTTRKLKLGYVWHIRNLNGEILQSSLDDEDTEEYYPNKLAAELDAKDAIQDYYT